MSLPTRTRALVLGGIRSGKSEYAEGLVAKAELVRYVATARRNPTDPDWESRIEAHRARRPGTWRTVEVGDEPLSLPGLLAAAGRDETVLVDDLGTWIAGLVARPADRMPVEIAAAASRLAAAVGTCPATLVLVSAEVGLSVVPATASGRAFADALGTLNRAVAAECETVVLVIAGNAVPVKGGL